MIEAPGELPLAWHVSYVHAHLELVAPAARRPRCLGACDELFLEQDLERLSQYVPVSVRSVVSCSADAEVVLLPLGTTLRIRHVESRYGCGLRCFVVIAGPFIICRAGRRIPR